MCADSTIHSFSQHNVYVEFFFQFGGSSQSLNALIGHRNEAYLADAIAALIGSMLGVSTVATFAESTAGVADGAKTGGSQLAWVLGYSFGRQRRNFSKGKVQVVRDDAGSNRNFLGEQGKEPILPYGLSIMKGYLYCRTPSFGHHLCHHDSNPHQPSMLLVAKFLQKPFQMIG